MANFAKTLAKSLDELTRQAGTKQSVPEPYSRSEEGPTASTTTRLNVSNVMSSAGSRVTLTMFWTYHMASRDKTSGAMLVEITEERTMVGAIDVCPDLSGSVLASLNVRGTAVALVGGATTTQSLTTRSDFVGTVDDQAALRVVSQVLKDETSWESASGNGRYSGSMSGAYASGEKGFVGRFEERSLSFTLDASGDSGAETAAQKSLLSSFVLDGFAFDDAYPAAERLWRNGRCVVVTAADYDAQTPIDVDEQEQSQHEERVDVDSETKFEAGLKHRFSGALSQPVAATLTNGAKSISPGRLDAGSGALTYKAPTEPEKDATVQLKSTSRRGIGTLVLSYRTGAEGLTLSLSGSLSGVRGGLGSVRIADTVAIGPVEFKKRSGEIWEGTGAWRSQIRSETVVVGFSQTCTGTESGTVAFTARLQTRAGTKAWVIDAIADAEGSGTQACGGFTVPTDGTSAAIFLAALKQIVIPAEGGRTPIHGQLDDAALGTWTASGTVIATTKK